ncbi:MAG: radical SAM protein [Chitinivibrionales bacterium]|nr:radical SAM protein [Chitinivibrionales bacterium]
MVRQCTMAVSEITAKTILRKQKRIDSWFISCCGMNLYRGCHHNCAYCDGRAEKYRVEGEFGKDLSVKVNAIDILGRELDPARKRKPLPRGYVFLGGGINDSYQPLEQKYNLTFRVLQLMYKYGYPLHILTKSTSVLRDIDLIEEIHHRSSAIVSMSFSSVDERICRHFEPGVASPLERLDVLYRIRQRGIPIGMYLMPVIPFVTDTPKMIDRTLTAARQAGIDFVIFGGMTLKDGRQREYFVKVLREYDPGLEHQFDIIYTGERWGRAIGQYYEHLNQVFVACNRRHNLPVRIPPRLYNDILDVNNKVVVMLEHIDYIHKLNGWTSPYGYAAYRLAQVKEPLGEMRDKLRSINGVGKRIASIVGEIIDTGSCRYLERLLRG